MTRPFLEGSLTKWTNVMKGWQHRWFVLDENSGLLSYYTSREKMMRGVRRGCVRLKGAVLGIDNEEDGNFTITTDSKTFHFQARNSSEREVWVTALENTILRHAPFYHEHPVQSILILRRHMPHHLLKVHFDDEESNYEANMKKFDRRISQADVLLQILIEQIQMMQDIISGLQEDVAIKTEVEKISKNYTVILDAVKLAIVLLQILKNTVDPVNGIGLVPGYVQQNRFRMALEDKSNLTKPYFASNEQFFPERDENVEDTSLSSTHEDAVPERVSGVEIGSDCLEGRRLMPNIIGALPDPSSHGEMALVACPESVPETSYSSSDDDFFDADEELYSPIQNRTALNFKYVSKDSKEGNASQKLNEPHTSGKNVASTSNPPMLNDGSLDYDALYEEDEDQNDLSMENHGSMITHLLSQVKIGMDLTKVVLPTFILETRSLLEMYADYFAHPDIFVSVVDKKTPKERMVQVVKWYLSAYHAGRKSAVAKKPYNPILGEVFFCHWNVPGSTGESKSADQVTDGPVPWCTRDQLTFAAEQVSHHPPISAFYAECVNKKIFFEAFVYTKSKFLGLSVGVHNIGYGTVHLLDHNEDYVVTFPSGYGRSILTTPWIELGGAVSVTCKKTGYYANIEFHTKPFYGGKKHRITGEIFSATEKKPFLTVAGEWNGVMEAKWTETGKTEVFVDVLNMPVTKKTVRLISEQKENESRRLWKEVTAGLKLNDIEKATNAKTSLEQKQREEAKKRKETNSVWETKLFYEKTEGDWHFKNPLCNRVNEWKASQEEK